MTDKKKPAHKIRDGRLSATLWANQTKEGATIYSVSFSRLYNVGEQLRDSASFSRDDLLRVAKLASEAHSWILATAATAP